MMTRREHESADHGRAEDEARRREADAILKRVRQETEPQVGVAAEALVLRAREHFGARDVDPEDRVAVLATRVGRLAGLIGLAVFAGLLVIQFATI